MSDDDSDDNSDDSDFLSSEEEVEDTPEAKRAARRLYRQGKPYRSKGVLSAEWLACRDAMKRGDSPGYAKLMGLLRKGKNEPLHGGWGGRTLLHWAAYYGCTNCVKQLLKDGANPRRPDAKGNLATHLARQRKHDQVALIIEFWASPTTNHDIENGPNFDYDPADASSAAAVELLAQKKRIEKEKYDKEKLEDELAAAGGVSKEDEALARKLGVVLAKKAPPKTSKQPTKPMKRESMGALENPENAKSEYEKFRALQAAEESEDEDGEEDVTALATALDEPTG